MLEFCNLDSSYALYALRKSCFSSIISNMLFVYFRMKFLKQRWWNMAKTSGHVLHHCCTGSQPNNAKPDGKFGILFPVNSMLLVNLVSEYKRVVVQVNLKGYPHSTKNNRFLFYLPNPLHTATSIPVGCGQLINNFITCLNIAFKKKKRWVNSIQEHDLIKWLVLRDFIIMSNSPWVINFHH